jgi:hypothetical protein
MNTTKVSLLILSASLTLAGCAHPPATMYQWGSYEEQVYAMYSDPGKVPIEDQIQGLEKDIELMKASNGAAPPGFHAHLGYLYYQSGKPAQAMQSFATEKALFPESAVYMDRLMARLKQ